MKRALFAREFRTALVPNLVTIVAILGTLLLVERAYGLKFGKAEDVRIFIDWTLLAGLVLSGFISGERCFPPEVKEQRLLFLSSLPLSRGGVWFAMVSGRLLAALTSLTAGILLRRPFLVLLKEQGAWPIFTIAATLAIVLYLVFFAGGVLFAFLFRKPLFSYAVGYPVLGLVLFETLLATVYNFSTPVLQDLQIPPLRSFDELSFPFSAVLFPLSLLLLLFAGCLLLSFHLFSRGEVGDIKRRMSNALVSSLAAVVYLGVVFWSSSFNLLPVRMTRDPVFLESFYFPNLPPLVSPDGRYLCVLDQIDGRPPFVRVSILENQTGRILSETTHVGFALAQWAGKGATLSLVTFNDSPLDRWGYLIPGSVDWFRLNPEGQEISKLRLRGVETLEPLPNGRILAVLQEGDILLLNGESGHSSKVAEASLDGNVVVARGGDSTLVYFDNIIQPDKAWVVGQGIREVVATRSTLRDHVVFFGNVIGSLNEAQAVLRQKFSQPSGVGGQSLSGSFVLPTSTEPWIPDGGLGPKAVLFLEGKPNGQTALWARNLSTGWEQLDISLGLVPPFFAGKIQLPLGTFVSGEAAFFAKNQKGAEVFIYDLKAGRLQRVAAGCHPNEKPFLWMSNPSGIKGILVNLICANNYSRRTLSFEYLPGLGKLQPLNRPPLPKGRGGECLYIDQHGWEIWVLDNLEIWRLSLQGKNLRLWPPK